MMNIFGYCMHATDSHCVLCRGALFLQKFPKLSAQLSVS